MATASGWLQGARVASPGAEVYGHAWVQWWHGEALPAWPAGPGDLLPGMPVWTVIDLLPTAFAAVVGQATTLEAGWNATVVVAFVLAALGGAAMARRVGGDPVTGALALALAPALQGAVASGLTEDWFVGLAALGLSRVGLENRKDDVAAGILLGLTATCGLVLAWGTALFAALFGLTLLYEDRRRWRSLALTAAVAALTVAPVAALHATRLSGRGHRMGAVRLQTEPLWPLNPWHGADLASFVAPGRVHWGDALLRLHPGYLGLSLLALAAAARHRGLALIAGLFVLMAPGAELAVAGQPTGVSNPIHAVVSALPLGSLLNHRARLLLFAAIALAALAGVAAQRVPSRWRGALWLVVALDCALLSPVGLPLPTAPTPGLDVIECHHPPQKEAGPRCLNDLPDGVVLHLPMAGPGIHFQRPLLLQAAHGRPILLNPNHPGLPPDLARTPTGRWLSGLAFPDPPPPPGRPELPAGVDLLVVEEPVIDAVAAVLGEPALRRADSAVWVRGDRP